MLKRDGVPALEPLHAPTLEDRLLGHMRQGPCDQLSTLCHAALCAPAISRAPSPEEPEQVSHRLNHGSKDPPSLHPANCKECQCLLLLQIVLKV